MDVVFTVIYGVIIATLRENSSDVRPGSTGRGTRPPARTEVGQPVGLPAKGSVVTEG